jgi:hypothetical protein
VKTRTANVMAILVRESFIYPQAPFYCIGRYTHWG